MPNPHNTEIIVLLDRSGSMQRVRADMEGAFNAFIEEQRKAGGGSTTKVSLYQFNTNFDAVYWGLPVQEVPPLRLLPEGGTALWDALGSSIVLTGERLARMPEESRPGKVVFVLITDGQENSSKEYRGREVREMIQHQEQKYSWGFIYLGSSPTTVADAHEIGIRAVSNYVGSGIGVRNMGSVVGSAIASYAANATMDFCDLSARIPENIPEEPKTP